MGWQKCAGISAMCLLGVAWIWRQLALDCVSWWKFHWIWSHWMMMMRFDMLMIHGIGLMSSYLNGH